MMNFRKISAASKGKLLLRYFTEDTPEPIHASPVDENGRNLDSGGRLTSYYTGRDGRATWRADMPALVANAIGINPRMMPRDAELARLFEGKRADNGEAWSVHKRKLSGFDFVFAPHKSVSLAAEFAATPAESATYWNAVDRAADRAMRYAAQSLGYARKGRGGEDGAEAGGVGWVSFRHHTARPTMMLQDGAGGATYLMDAPTAGDPHMHIHNFFMNLVVTPDGRVGSLDTKALTDTKVKEIGAYFQAMLAQELRRLGCSVAYDAKEEAIILTAIPEEISKAYSKGRSQIEKKAKAFAKSQGIDWDRIGADAKMDILRDAGAEGRLGKMKTDERRLWREQAKALGWQHETAFDGKVYEVLTDQQRLDRAYKFAARHLAEEFRTAAVITHEKLGLYAARGLIGVGIAGGPDDIRAVINLLEERGIRFRGEHVGLVTGGMDGQVRVTNTAQLRIERSVLDLARANGSDRSEALSSDVIRAAMDRAGVRFNGEQRAAIYALGLGGRLTMLTGAAGVGKTTLLEPLVAAWQDDRRFSPEGRDVIGAALSWRQADALRETGIRQTYAMEILLRAIETGELKTSRNTVLVVDEISQIAPRQILKLLELQAKTGMTIKMLGDREQAQSIEGGDAMELIRRALPTAALPEVLTTVRQRTDRGREIAGLFREGNAGDALMMKRGDGQAMMVGGDRGQVVAAIADLYISRRDILLSGGQGKTITVSAPTNDDVAEIGAAIRERLKARGEIAPAEKVWQAINQTGQTYDLALSVGDRVRLFRKTWGTVNGEAKQVGNNGNVVTIVAELNDGLRIRTQDGEVADVKWQKLMDDKTKRLFLGHGHAITIDAAQGITSDEHINAMPRGTSSVTGFKAYVAESRARGATWTVISEGAVLEAERRRQALGDNTTITKEDLWKRAGADLSNKPYKALGIDLLAASQQDREKARDTFAALSFIIEDAIHQDPATAVKVSEKVRAEAIDASLGRQRRGFEAAIAENDVMVADIRQRQQANQHLRMLANAGAADPARPNSPSLGR